MSPVADFQEYITEPSINMSNMAMEPVDGGPGRSYRYFTGPTSSVRLI
jgi:hypothetical protein